MRRRRHRRSLGVGTVAAQANHRQEVGYLEAVVESATAQVGRTLTRRCLYPNIYSSLWTRMVAVEAGNLASHLQEGGVLEASALVEAAMAEVGGNRHGRLGCVAPLPQQ